MKNYLDEIMEKATPTMLNRRKYPTFKNTSKEETEKELAKRLKPKQLEVFKDYYDNGLSVEEIAEKHNIEQDKIKGFIVQMRKRIMKFDPNKPLNPNLDPETGQFKKGIEPWNKGKTGYMGANKTSFTKDTHKQPDIGTPKQGKGQLITTTKDKVKRKDARGKEYMFSKRESYPRWLLKQNGIEVPDNCVVWHIDGDYTNNDLDNLEVITRAESARRTSANRRKGINESKALINDNFWKWFGNSKVVDKNGKPLVVYHGTSDTFNTFDIKLAGKNSLGLGKGFYFIDSQRTAKTYGKKIMNVYLSIQNPFYVYDYAKNITDEQFRQIVNNASATWALSRLTPDEFYEKHKNWSDNSKLQELSNAFGYNNSDNYFNALNEILGIDGLIKVHKTMGITEYVAFYPNQIKSIKNKGTWNPQSDNIYENGIGKFKIY